MKVVALVFLVAGAVLLAASVDAAVLCAPKKGGGVRLRPTACKKKEQQVDLTVLGVQTSGPKGDQGEQGAQGAPGIVGLEGQACSAGQFVNGFDASGAPRCGAAARPTVLQCGSSGRDVSTFTDLSVLRGCQPDGTTQAMLVTRNGQASVDANVLKAYLNQGGIVITEFSIGDEIFNQAFGTSVVQGAFMGNCSDNVNPAVQFTPDDPFWQANAPFVPEPGATTGCGFNLETFPGIVPLGGWSVGTVSLAYRDLGEGRLWLVESDWQDTEPTFNETSRTMLEYMINQRR
jgi:hypothetical protein